MLFRFALVHDNECVHASLLYIFRVALMHGNDNECVRGVCEQGTSPMQPF